ncbi:MAG: hypothetical protein M1546_01605 [Chloroflexi bacterium]|nr:hypothetical protein [Chloroflexota bacterium]
MNASQAQPVTAPAEAQTTGVRAWDRRLQQIVTVVGRLILAYLFFANVWWKLPPTFGCANNFEFPTANAQGRPTAGKSSGLCYWIGVESVYATQPHPVFVADTHYAGGPVLQVDIAPLARLNGAFIDGFVKPNIAWFGYFIFGAEAFIAITMFVGLFSRLGGLVAIGMSLQLMVGLAGIPQPFEWEWGYNLMVTLSLVMFGLAPGRYLGVDALLRPPLLRASQRGSVLAKLVLVLT